MSCKLNDVCELIVDCPHSTEPDEGEGYPIIRTPNIGAGYLDLEGVQRVSKAAYDRRNARAVPRPNDLILAREAPAGNVGIIREGMEVCLGQRTVLIRPNAEKVSPLFLNYYLNAPKQRHALLSNSNGATVSHVNMPIIRNLVIELPDRETQDRIADVLTAYDELIENNRRQIKLLEEAARRLYKEWFIDLKFPGHETTPIVDGLPEGWQKGSLLDFAGFYRGKSYTSKDLVESGKMRLANLNSIAAYGGWACGAEKPYAGAYKPEQLISFGDVIMAVTDMTKERRLVGHVARVPRQADGFLISMDLIKLVPKGVTDNYLYAALRFSGVAEMIAMLANGTNVLHLKPDALNRVSFVRPDYGTQKQFSAASESLFAMSEHLEQEAVLAREARDRLLPKLMTGEVKE